MTKRVKIEKKDGKFLISRVDGQRYTVEPIELEVDTSVMDAFLGGQETLNNLGRVRRDEVEQERCPYCGQITQG